MSYCRSPYYIFGSGTHLCIYEDLGCLGNIPYEAVGQFLVNLIDRVNFGNVKEFLKYISLGLKCERKAYTKDKRQGWLDEGDKLMTRKDLAKALRMVARALEK
jgi:hypothetical protein